MLRRYFFGFVGIFCALAVTSSPAVPVQAEPLNANSAYDLIDAVNALRASYGLPAYSINSILMYTAQSHAEFMAATGGVTHYGPGGISVTDRLLAAGYPLAGDLSLGGFRSENITGGNESMTAQAAVNQWTGDAPHLNTMISTSLTEIGAGVAVANGRVYYVIDCALPTTSGAPQSSSQTSGGSSTLPAGNSAIPVAVVSTPNENGEVLHQVQSGQTLWQIAIAYGAKIDEIKSLNNLADNTIYPGDTLLIKRDVVQASNTREETSTVIPTILPTSSVTVTSLPTEPSPTASSENSSTSESGNSTVMSVVIGLIALALLAGGFVAWRGDAPSSH